jgi:hypothetical protein
MRSAKSPAYLAHARMINQPTPAFMKFFKITDVSLGSDRHKLFKTR